MKLSEAIRLGAKIRPQAFFEVFSENGCSCVLGAMAEAHGYEFYPGDNNRVYGFIADILAHTNAQIADPKQHIAWDTLQELNDHKKWSRKRIADWLEGKGL